MVESSAGNIKVNRYIASHGQDRAVVLYWYQMPLRAVASEWAAKFWIVPDAIATRRTDTALVRVIVWTAGRSDEAATRAALEFTRKAYPALMGTLPR
jgi:EpsI family protein